MSKMRFLLFFLFLFAIVPAIAQTDDEKEKIKERERREIAFAEEILKDARNLRLPESRAYIYARIGDALWQRDEKRARELFGNAISELVAAQTEVESEKRNQQFFQNLLYGQTPRWEILWLIANRDADLALEAQIKTRPPRLPLTLEVFAETRVYSNLFHAVRSEIQNEQRLIAIAADQNPQRAAKLIRESLKKTVSYEVLNLLRKIHGRDAELAARLAEEVGETFLARDFTKNLEEMNVLSNFINQFGAEKSADDKSLRISEKLRRDLIAKMIDTWLNPEVTSQFGALDPSILEKYFPERAARVRQKFQRINNPNRPKEYEEYEKLMQSNPSGEEMVSQAANFSKNLRQQIYQQAAQKFVEKGNLQQAEKIVREIYPDQAEYYVSQWHHNLATRAISEGKFDEAARLIAQIPNEDTQINALVYMASVIFQKDREKNKNWALAVLDQARAMIPNHPETHFEVNALMSIAAQYAGIEPARAFDLLETVVPQIDELVGAQAVLAKYNANTGNFRQGEFQVNSGSYPYGAYNLPHVLRELKKSDAERVLQITNRFTRLDARLSLQVQLVENNAQIANLPMQGRIYRTWISDK
jgi:hypothetical protein